MATADSPHPATKSTLSPQRQRLVALMQREANRIGVRKFDASDRLFAGMEPDGEMVGGFDPEVPGLFWCAGQGGYGIQSSPAMSAACAAIIVGGPLPAELQRAGLTVARLSPERLAD